MKNIIFFAKVGNLTQLPYGGGEVGNRRTMGMYEKMGCKVDLIPRYCLYKKKSALVYFRMVIGDILSLLNLLIKLLTGKKGNSIVHISGFTGTYMVYESIAVRIAHLIGYTTIYEIRGGGIIENYNSNGKLYKYFFKKAIESADCVFSQGYENKHLIEQFSTDKFFYYPNCIEAGFLPKVLPIKSISPVKLVFIGRLMPAKNVLVAIKCLEEVKKHINDVTLDIIGDGVDFPEYVKELNDYVENHDLTGSCYFRGKCGREEIKKLLTDKSFFIFPSEEKREGQSNSLTETMAYGIIPIATPQGYTRSIVGDDNLIVDSLNPIDFASKILSIIQTNTKDYYSKKMFDVVNSKFTYDKVYSEFYQRIKSLNKDIS